MDQQEALVQGRRFGQYLRRIREERKLSLDAVQEMSMGFPDRVTKSHLSRIENGRAIPTFPRMFTLGQIYGVRVSSLADRFELELKREMAPAGYQQRSADELLAEARRLRVAGRYPEALRIIDEIIDTLGETDAFAGNVEASSALRLDRIECLYHLGRFSLAKEECEEILNLPDLPGPTRVRALEYFVICCFRLGRYTVALMGLDQAERDVRGPGVPPRLSIDLAAIRGNVYAAMKRYEEARQAYGIAVEGYQALDIPFEACRTRVNLTSVMIELEEFDRAREDLAQALEEAEAGGYDRQRALVLSNMAVLAYRTGDLTGAESCCIRSNAIARPREYVAVVFRNCYYLWKMANDAGDASARAANERALKTYLGRVEEPLAEAEAFRTHLAGDAS